MCRSFDVLVVGAGFAGAVMAERIAAERGLRVLVIDRRDHIAGNAFDHHDAHGVLIHRYGPHIFHTNSEKVFDYLSRFTAWRPYEHRVLADVGGRHVPMPINRTTLNALYGLGLTTEAEVQAFFDARAEPRERLTNSEDAVVAKVGRELYETLFRGYTRKQWGLDPSELHAQVCARIPVRVNDDDRYFGDRFQSMPADGYTALFERLLDHPLIEVRVRGRVRGRDARRTTTSCGPGRSTSTTTAASARCRTGRCASRPRRSPTPGGGLVQPVAVINQPAEDVAYTRVTEYRHLTGQRLGRLDAALRVPERGRRSLLPRAAAREPGALQPLRRAGGARAGRHVRRPARPVPVPEHGSGRRPGTVSVRGYVQPRTRPCLNHSSPP